jgi:hypothetical protein
VQKPALCLGLLKMRSLAWLLLLASSALAGARPLLEARDDDDSPVEIDPNKWADPVRNFFGAVGRRVEKCRESPNFPNAPPCDLSNFTMPVGKDFLSSSSSSSSSSLSSSSSPKTIIRSVLTETSVIVSVHQPQPPCLP